MLNTAQTTESQKKQLEMKIPLARFKRSTGTPASILQP